MEHSCRCPWDQPGPKFIFFSSDVVVGCEGRKEESLKRAQEAGLGVAREGVASRARQLVRMAFTCLNSRWMNRLLHGEDFVFS